MEEQQAQQEQQSKPTSTEVIIDQPSLDDIHKINGKLLQGKLQFADLQLKIENFYDKKQFFNDKIEELKNNINKLNSDLDTADEQIKIVSLQKTQLKSALEEISKSFQSKINDVAKAHGIDSDSDELWNFDLSSGKFIKA